MCISMYALSWFFCDGQLSISFNLLTCDSKNLRFQNEKLSNQIFWLILKWGAFLCFGKSLVGHIQTVNANICNETALKLPVSDAYVIFKEVIPWYLRTTMWMQKCYLSEGSKIGHMRRVRSALCMMKLLLMDVVFQVTQHVSIRRHNLKLKDCVYIRRETL